MADNNWSSVFYFLHYTSLLFTNYYTQKKASAMMTTSNIPYWAPWSRLFYKIMISFILQNKRSYLAIFRFLTIITYRCWTITLENNHLSNILTILHRHYYYILICCNFPNFNDHSSLIWAVIAVLSHIWTKLFSVCTTGLTIHNNYYNCLR